MSSSPHLEILLAHDRWATRQLLDASAALDDSQLDRSFEMGRGSLRATLHHTIDAMHVWSQRLSGKPAAPLECDGRSVAALIDWHDQVTLEFAERVSGGSDERLTMPRKDQTILAPRGGIAMHVLTHGMHHRAQALNMLRHLGVSPPPKNSVFEWLLETGHAEMT